MARLRGGRGWGCARSSLSVGLSQAGGAMCGYRGKRCARSLTRGVDSLLDVRREPVVPRAGFPRGDLQGDGAEGVLVAGGVTVRRDLPQVLFGGVGDYGVFSGIWAHLAFCGDAASEFPGVEFHEVLRFTILAGVPCPSDSAPEIIRF